MSKLDATNLKEFNKLVTQSKVILVMQPAKPDTDSLGSSLALEEILGDLGKKVVLYAEDEIPKYLRLFMPGWDRVQPDFPKNFDLAIAVDFGSPDQFKDTIKKYNGRLEQKPFVVIDHHSTRTAMPFKSLDLIIPNLSSTGELLTIIAGELDWKINAAAADAIINAILADTGNLRHTYTTADTVQAVADMLRKGINIYDIRRRFELADALSAEMFYYKAELMQRAQFVHDGQIAYLTIPKSEMDKWSKLRDPSEMVVNEMRAIQGVRIAAVFRNLGDIIKVSLRANSGIAAPIAEQFGGGGHPPAAGFSSTTKKMDELVEEFLKVAKLEIAKHEDL